MLSALCWLLPRAFFPQAEQDMLWKIEAVSLLQHYSYFVLAMALISPYLIRRWAIVETPLFVFFVMEESSPESLELHYCWLEIGYLIGFVMQHPWEGNWMLIWHLIMKFFLCFTWINVHMNCFNACITTNIQVYIAAWNTAGERSLNWNSKE